MNPTAWVFVGITIGLIVGHLTTKRKNPKCRRGCCTGARKS